MCRPSVLFFLLIPIDPCVVPYNLVLMSSGDERSRETKAPFCWCRRTQAVLSTRGVWQRGMLRRYTWEWCHGTHCRAPPPLCDPLCSVPYALTAHNRHKRWDGQRRPSKGLENRLGAARVVMFPALCCWQRARDGVCLHRHQGSHLKTCASLVVMFWFHAEDHNPLVCLIVLLLVFQGTGDCLPEA